MSGYPQLPKARYSTIDEMHSLGNHLSVRRGILIQGYRIRAQSFLDIGPGLFRMILDVGFVGEYEKSDDEVADPAVTKEGTWLH